MLAVDTSHLAQPRVVTVQEWLGLSVLGYGLAIVCAHAGGIDTGLNPYARESLINARSANLLTATYITIRPGEAKQVIQEAHDNLGPEWEFCRFAAVDCEWAETLSVQDVVEGVTEVQALNKAAWIYTGAWYWRDKMGNPTLPMVLPLWDASYGQRPSLDMHPQYGGWTRRAAHQYAGDAPLAGIKVDVSLFDESTLEGETGVSTDNMKLTNQQLDALALMTGIGWGGTEHDQLDALINREAHYREVLIPGLENTIKAARTRTETIYATVRDLLSGLGAG